MSEAAEITIKSEGNGELVVEASDGKEKTYYLNPIRTMWLEVEHLKVGHSFNSYYLGDDAKTPPQPELELRVFGTAKLARSISLIGAPLTRSSTLRISFQADDGATRKRREALAKEAGQAYEHNGVYLGFTKHDWEIGNDDEWWADCAVSPATFEHIAAAVSSGSLRGLSLGLQLHNIYSDDRWSPPAFKTDWFLRPRHEGDFQSRDTALG